MELKKLMEIKNRINFKKDGKGEFVPGLSKRLSVLAGRDGLDSIDSRCCPVDGEHEKRGTGKLKNK